MIYFLLVTTWFTCSFPDSKRPCVEAFAQEFATEDAAAVAYAHQSGALNRKLYRIDVGLHREAFKITPISFNVAPIRTNWGCGEGDEGPRTKETCECGE